MDSVLSRNMQEFVFFGFWGGGGYLCVRFLVLCDSVILKSVPTVAQVMIHDEVSHYPVTMDKTVLSLL